MRSKRATIRFERGDMAVLPAFQEAMVAALIASTVLSMVAVGCGTTGLGERLLEPLFWVTSSPVVNDSGNWSSDESRASTVRWRVAADGRVEGSVPTLKPLTTPLDNRSAVVSQVRAGSSNGTPDVTLGPAMRANGNTGSAVEAKAAVYQSVASRVRPMHREVPVPVLKEAFEERPSFQRKTCVDAGEAIYAGRDGVLALATRVRPERNSGCVRGEVTNAPVAPDPALESADAASPEPREYAMTEPLPAEELQEIRGGFRIGGVEFSFAVSPQAGTDGVSRPVSVNFGNFQVDIPKSGGQFALVDRRNAGLPPSVDAGNLPARQSVDGQLAVVIQNFNVLAGSPMAERLNSFGW